MQREWQMNLKTIGLGLAIVAGLLFTQASVALADNAGDTKAEAYCVRKGGVVQTRIPEYGTNGGTALVLARKAEFCQFTSTKDGSQINVILSTLTTQQPTLAALAYYAQVPLGSCTGNPGSCYCSLIGGTDLFGGINAAGGGWVLDSDPTDVLEACVFPDQSSIDSWGLAYHSADIIRGKNLAHALKYPNPYTAAGHDKTKRPY
jgi:putative hemolysin